MPPDHNSLLAIHLNDHLASALAGVDLANRARGSNEGTELGTSLGRVAGEMEEEVARIRAVMRDVGARPDRLKTTAARAGERVGRLKLNGAIREYSPLSPVVELEGLELAAEHVSMLWRSLEGLGDARLTGHDFARFAQEAGDRRGRLADHRASAARTAFAG